MKNAAVTKECTRVQQDITLMIEEFIKTTEQHFIAVQKQRSEYPDGLQHTISENQINDLFTMCHQLRECGEQIDFITYSKALDQAEILLKKLRAPIQFRRTDILGDLAELLTTLQKKTVIV